jgi:hypothetical protein
LPHYSYEHTFQPGGTKDKQEEHEMPCPSGTLTNVLINFKAGCHGLVHVHIDEALHQIFPTNPEEDYSFDDYTVEIKDKYELLPGTRKLYLRGYNEGVYPHTIHVAFEIEAKEVLSEAEEAVISIAELLAGEDS